MKQWITLSLAVLSVAGVASAQAQQATASVTLQQVEIHAPAATYHLAPHEFDDYAHTYRTDQGLDISFTQRGRHAFVAFGGKDREELVPVAARRFTTDKGAWIEFSADDELVTISMPKALADQELS